MIDCSIGITAYNEAANIGNLLEHILEQRLETVAVQEIIVVASGCTDQTEAIVQKFMGRDGRIRLLSQPRREGKASAMNLFIREAANDVMILCSADLQPEATAVEHLVAPLPIQKWA